MAHSYPADLAEVVLRTWHDGSSLTDEYCEAVHDHDTLPPPDVLEIILSTCYQASLLREEERPVRFRLIVANAASFPAPGGPPHGLHRLLFDEPRPLSHHELRRLAPAVDFHRALIGAQIEPRDGLMLWGMITTGPRWVQAMRPPLCVPVVQLRARRARDRRVAGRDRALRQVARGRGHVLGSRIDERARRVTGAPRSSLVG